MSRPATNRVLNQFVERARNLHTLPATAVRILELTNDPQVDLRLVKECIETDPALTGKILRIVNSSMFGLSREVSDLNQAIALLGITPLKMLVLGLSLPKNLFSGVEVEVLRSFWLHTLAKAVAARTLAQTTFRIIGDEAYIAGLLQGIGQLVLIQELDTAYISFLERVVGEAADLTEMEVSTLGFDHASLSARLLDHWGFPARLVDAVGTPHEVEHILGLPQGARELPQILHLSELLARFLTTRNRDILQELLSVGQRYCGLDSDQLGELVIELDVQVPLLAAVYSQNIDVEFEAVLEQAYSQLSEVSEEAAIQLSTQAAAVTQVDPEQETLGIDEATPQATNSDQALTNSPEPTAIEPAAVVDPVGIGLIVDLVDRAAAAVHTCRQSRIPLSLMLIEVANASEQVFRLGPDGFHLLMTELQIVIQQHSENDEVFRHDDARFAVFLADYERSETVAVARRILARVADGLRQAGRSELPLGVGVSCLSSVPPNFPASDLITAAERCLYGAHQCGGGIVKSIDL